MGVDHTEDDYTTPLACCEYDAESLCKTLANLYQIKEAEYFSSSTCTTEFFHFKMDQYSRKLKKGDNLILYFSGHGGQVRDLNRDELQADKLDETLCLYDRMLLDDEIFMALSKFKAGINILFFSDSCHSGTISRTVRINENPPKGAKFFKGAERFQEEHIELYNKIKGAELSDVKANLFLISACQDHEYAFTGSPNSLFTGVILREIQKKPNMTLSQLGRAVSTDSKLRQKQTPRVTNQGASTKPLTKLLLSEKPKEKKKGLEIKSYYIHFKTEALAKKVMAKGKNWFGKEAKLILSDVNTVEIQYKNNYVKSNLEIGDQIKNIKKILIDKKCKAEYIEPDFQIALPETHSKSVATANPNEFLKSWPAPQLNIFDWYKKDEYTQLESALQEVESTIDAQLRNVRIGHIDTGCWPDHPASPVRLMIDLGMSFVRGESKDPKVRIKNGKANFHGLSTSVILAGGMVGPNEGRYDQNSGEVGAIPFAEIVPLRIGDEVFLIQGRLDAFVQAMYRAIDLQCDVISISMGGAPTRKMAEAINLAYEKGIVVVAAAGNNFNVPLDIFVPEEVVYPSRFDRVITAVGATANQHPYDFDAQKGVKSFPNGEQMQGNSGPASVMKTAIAAYTPNVPWATVSLEETDPKYSFSRRGGGTSSATPQIAAAAALYIVYYRNQLIAEGYNDTWKQAESVRQALFSSADSKKIPESKKYYGNGVLQAKKALSKFIKVTDDQKAERAKVSDSLIGEFIALYTNLF